MTSKFGMAGGIPERRVRPIWDAIDSRQFKNALKLSTALLSKFPNSPYGLVLKALILERMGKPEEAFSVCLCAKELLYKNDSLLMDDLTLSTLQIVFQRLDHLELATSCYEYACGKFTNNMELMMGLFNCYVREYSFVKQQQIAIKMYKIVGEERFLLWAVCSIYLQVLCGNGEEKLLRLAEGLIKKHIASHSLHEPEALVVYVSILEQQSKYMDAYEILSGNLGSILSIEVEKLRIQGKLLARAGDFTAAASIFQKVLVLCPDDWEYFLHYLGCLLEDDSSWYHDSTSDPIHPSKYVNCKLLHLTEAQFDSRISDALAFVYKLQAQANSDFLRSPSLANLEIERRKHLFGKGNDENIMKALLHYFTRFGHLACFTSDVEGFLQVLTYDKRTELLEMLMKNFDSSTVSTKVLGQSINLLKVKELIGDTFKLPVAELEDSAMKMVKMYCKNLPLSKDLDPQESIHGEELLSMAGNALAQLFWRTGNLGYLLEAILVLEFGLTIRRNSWQYKILLLHLYSNLRAVSLSYEWYKSLDVKNIMLESVSHHILPQMFTSPLWVNLENLLKDYLKFMDDHFRESADLTFLAYRHQNYSKVIEFVQFKERLQRSGQYLVARLEVSMLQLKQNADNLEEEERVLESLKRGTHFLELSSEIGRKSLTFNEDLQSRPWWTPIPEKNYLLGPFEGVSYRPREDLAKERAANVQKVVERRSLLPRMIYLSIQSASAAAAASFKDVKSNGSITDPNVSSELKFLLERYALMLGYTFNDAIEMLIGTRNEASEEEFSANIIEWATFAVFFNAWTMNCHEENKPNGTLYMVNKILDKYIITQKVNNLMGGNAHDFSNLVQLITEPLAWHSLVIQSYVRSSLPSGKKKKKSTQSNQSSSSPLSQDIRNSIQCLCDTLEDVMKWLEEQIKKPENENVDFMFDMVKRRRNENESVFKVVEDFMMCKNDVELLGEQISKALESWVPVEVVRKLVSAQCTVLSEFLRICESKIKLLNKQIAQL